MRHPSLHTLLRAAADRNNVTNTNDTPTEPEEPFVLGVDPRAPDFDYPNYIKPPEFTGEVVGEHHFQTTDGWVTKTDDGTVRIIIQEVSDDQEPEAGTESEETTP